MRFMMLARADKNTEAGVLPSEELVAAMGRFNEEMVKAGVLLAGEGIQPSSKGARVKFSRGAPTVTLAVIVLGFVGVVAMRPSEYRVARCDRHEGGGRRRPDPARHDLPHRLVDQADHGRGDDDPRGGMPAAAGRAGASAAARPTRRSTTERDVRLSIRASPDRRRG